MNAFNTAGSAHVVAAAPPGPVRHLRAEDVEDYTLQLHDWQLEYDQLDCGAFRGELLDVRLGGVQLFVESTNRSLQQRGTLMAGSISMAAMLEGDGELLVNGVRPGPNGLAAVHDGELGVTSPARCRLMGVVAEEALVQQAAVDLLGRPLEVRRGLVAGFTGDQAHMARFVTAMRRGTQLAQERPELLDDAAVRAELRDGILVQLVGLLDDARRAEQDGRAAQRKRMVDRACALMLARPYDTPALDEICHEIGASVRKLNYCFQDVVGMSPTRYIRTWRLNAARRELRRSLETDLSVYDVASRWGFWHFGRFSCAYKRQFSESPSQSLRRARRGLNAP